MISEAKVLTCILCGQIVGGCFYGAGFHNPILFYGIMVVVLFVSHWLTRDRYQHRNLAKRSRKKAYASSYKNRHTLR
jgi:uncharacterized membrane protein